LQNIGRDSVPSIADQPSYSILSPASCASGEKEGKGRQRNWAVDSQELTREEKEKEGKGG
jgi:hypothetical protein